MLVYIWSRRNPFVRMNFFGVLNFQVCDIRIYKYNLSMKNIIVEGKLIFIFSIQAPYLPWILLGFSILLGNAIWVDLVGMAVGHMYYFAEDVFPQIRGGFRILQTPQIL